jgi:hypothetical protein
MCLACVNVLVWTVGQTGSVAWIPSVSHVSQVSTPSSKQLQLAVVQTPVQRHCVRASTELVAVRRAQTSSRHTHRLCTTARRANFRQSSCNFLFVNHLFSCHSVRAFIYRHVVGHAALLCSARSLYGSEPLLPRVEQACPFGILRRDVSDCEDKN